MTNSAKVWITATAPVRLSGCGPGVDLGTCAEAIVFPNWVRQEATGAVMQRSAGGSPRVVDPR